MLELTNALNNYDDNGGSYVFEIERYMPNEYTHGKSDDEGYKIVYYGSRHLVIFPDVATFSMQCTMRFVNGYLGEQMHNAECIVHNCGVLTADGIKIIFSNRQVSIR